MDKFSCNEVYPIKSIEKPFITTRLIPYDEHTGEILIEKIKVNGVFNSMIEAKEFAKNRLLELTDTYLYIGKIEKWMQF